MGLCSWNYKFEPWEADLLFHVQPIFFSTIENDHGFFQIKNQSNGINQERWHLYDLREESFAHGAVGRSILRTRPSGQRCVLKHFWAYPLTEMGGGNLSTAIASFSGRYAKEVFLCYSWLSMP